MTRRILVSNLMMIKEKDRFDRELRALGFDPVWPAVSQYLTAASCRALMGDIDGWLAGDDEVTADVLRAASPRLQVISKWGTGIDSIDLAAAKSMGIPVLNSRAAFASAVAECAIGYMLMLMRHLGSVDRAVRDGGWPKPCGTSPAGKTIGLVGYGAIGRRIGDLASAFGMRIVYHDPAVDLAMGSALSVSLPALAKRADVVVLACNLSPDNTGMIDADFLASMKPGAVLINVARGPLVQTDPLIAALSGGRLAGAALDVYETEPLPPDSRLTAMENVVLGSHNANNETSAVEFVHRNTIANLLSVLKPTRRLEEVT